MFQQAHQAPNFMVAEALPNQELFQGLGSGSRFKGTEFGIEVAGCHLAFKSKGSAGPLGLD